MALYPYQEEGVRFLMAHAKAYLADGMGLGKTVQALVALARTLAPGSRVLVVCPAAVRANWRHEVGAWAPGLKVTVTSYASLDKLREGSWDAVVLDEAHYCKNRKAKRTKRALKLAAEAPRAILLSGTPMPNHPGELWAPTVKVWPELVPPHLKRFDAWLRYFTRFTMTKYGPRIFGFKNAKDFKELMFKFMLRRKLEDVALELPPLRFNIEYLPLAAGDFETALRQTPGAKDLLSQMLREDERPDGPHVSVLRRIIGEFKVGSVIARLKEELTEGQYEKIVVMYHHTDVGQRIVNGLVEAGIGTVWYKGGMTQANQELAVRAFQTDTHVRVFVGQQTATGEGLNLQVASEIVLVEPAWSPDANRQAIKRIHRIGSDAPCRARVFAVPGTLDEAVLQTVVRKSNIQEEGGM